MEFWPSGRSQAGAEGAAGLGGPLWMAPLLQVQSADLARWSGAVFCSACCAVDIGLLALTGSVNRVPICFSGYDALDCPWVVPRAIQFCHGGLGVSGGEVT